MSDDDVPLVKLHNGAYEEVQKRVEAAFCAAIDRSVSRLIEDRALIDMVVTRLIESARGQAKQNLGGWIFSKLGDFFMLLIVILLVYNLLGFGGAVAFIKGLFVTKA